MSLLVFGLNYLHKLKPNNKYNTLAGISPLFVRIFDYRSTSNFVLKVIDSASTKHLNILYWMKTLSSMSSTYRISWTCLWPKNDLCMKCTHSLVTHAVINVIFSTSSISTSLGQVLLTSVFPPDCYLQPTLLWVVAKCPEIEHCRDYMFVCIKNK